MHFSSLLHDFSIFRWKSNWLLERWNFWGGKSFEHSNARRGIEHHENSVMIHCQHCWSWQMSQWIHPPEVKFQSISQKEKIVKTQIPRTKARWDSLWLTHFYSKTGNFLMIRNVPKSQKWPFSSIVSYMKNMAWSFWNGKFEFIVRFWIDNLIFFFSEL